MSEQPQETRRWRVEMGSSAKLGASVISCDETGRPSHDATDPRTDQARNGMADSNFKSFETLETTPAQVAACLLARGISALTLERVARREWFGRPVWNS